jgi:hypothetical protein
MCVGRGVRFEFVSRVESYVNCCHDCKECDRGSENVRYVEVDCIAVDCVKSEL